MLDEDKEHNVMSLLEEIIIEDAIEVEDDNFNSTKYLSRREIM
jgi:hypothetical protein